MTDTFVLAEFVSERAKLKKNFLVGHFFHIINTFGNSILYLDV